MKSWHGNVVRIIGLWQWEPPLIGFVIILKKTLEEQSSYQWIKTPWHSCDNRGNWPVTSHYLTQCWNIVNWTLGKKLQLNLNRCWYIFIEKCIWRMAAIVSRPLCANHNECGLHIANISFNIVRHISFPRCDTTVMQWCWEWFYYHCCVTILLNHGTINHRFMSITTDKILWSTPSITSTQMKWGIIKLCIFIPSRYDAIAFPCLKIIADSPSHAIK